MVFRITKELQNLLLTEELSFDEKHRQHTFLCLQSMTQKTVSQKNFIREKKTSKLIEKKKSISIDRSRSF